MKSFVGTRGGATKMMKLIEAVNGTSINGVDCPREFYWVLVEPAPLAGMRYPRADFPWRNLYSKGFRHLVSLQPGSYDPSPLSTLFSEQLEDLIRGGPPKDAKGEQQLIAKAVSLVRSALMSNEGVLVHCIGGRGRTGTVVGCVLRELGFEAEETVAYLNRIHQARGRAGWPESNWQGQLVLKWTPQVDSHSESLL